MPHQVGSTTDQLICEGSSGSEGAGSFCHLTCHVRNHTIIRVQFRAGPCMWSQFAAMALAALVEGRSTTHAGSITPDLLKQKLIDLPLGRHFIPSLTIEALDKALAYAHEQRSGIRGPETSQ